MTTIYQGQGGNILPPVAVAIASSTDTTPIIVDTTPNPHGLLDGVDVSIKGHTVNVGANGIWRIGFIDPTHYKLLGSVGSGLGAGAGGTSQGFAFGYALVDGSVPPTAGAFNTPTEFNADQASWSFERMGDRKVVGQNWNDASDDVATIGTAYDFYNIVAANTYTQGNNFPATPFGAALTGLVFNQGDYLEAECDLNVLWETGAGSGAIIKLALFAQISDANGTIILAPTKIPGSMRFTGFPTATEILETSMHLSGAIRMGTGAFPVGNGLSVKIFVYAQSTIATLASNIYLTGDKHAVVRQYRLTGMPQ